MKQAQNPNKNKIVIVIMEDNNQPNVPPSFPPTPVREMDEELTQFLNYIRRETQIRNHINTALSTPLNIRPISSLTPNIPSNQFYFHDLFRHAGRPIGYNNATNVVLANSLREQGGVKNVISDDGKKQLTTETYEKGKFMNTVCPILQEEFSEGDKVTVLPCKHCFDPDGIMRWLESNKAECPVCRHKLLSKEVSNQNNEEDSDDDSVPPLIDEDEDDDNDEDDTTMTITTMTITTMAMTTTTCDDGDSNSDVPHLHKPTEYMPILIRALALSWCTQHRFRPCKTATYGQMSISQEFVPVPNYHFTFYKYNWPNLNTSGLIYNSVRILWLRQ